MLLIYSSIEKSSGAPSTYDGTADLRGFDLKKEKAGFLALPMLFYN
jgi:hypothetical protein